MTSPERTVLIGCWQGADVRLVLLAGGVTAAPTISVESGGGGGGGGVAAGLITLDTEISIRGLRLLDAIRYLV